MASLHHSSVRKSALLYLLVLLLFASLLVSTLSHSQPQRRRKLLASEIEEEVQLPKKKSTLLMSKNQTKTIKPTKPTNTSTTTTTTLPKTTLKKFNSTTSSKSSTNSTKKPLDLPKTATPPKNKTQSIITQKEKTPKPQNTQQPINTQSLSAQKTPKSQNNQQPINTQSLSVQKTKSQKPKTPIKPNWMEFADEDDFVSEFRDFPSKFQQTLLPDLERISITSRAYINQANKDISEGFRPLVGKQYAPTVASAVSCIFILIPLLLVSLIFNRIKTYFSLQKILIFIQVYLSIYFSILSFASLVTGLEPLKFFYASSQSTYICLQVLQTLGYVLYLLMLIMYFVLVFSTDTGLGLKIVGLGQTIVGFAVGLHYYVAVFHRAVLHQPPKTNWKIHGIYATCFFVICLLANAERRKKAYLEEGGEEGKKS